jgi:putative membrane protein
MLWLKAFHLMSLIAWMAALLYLPRLFVYHAGAAPDSELSDTFKVMERRLLRGIMTPAMIGTWIFGLWLAIVGGYFSNGGWLHVKLLLVVAMSGFHGFCVRWMKDFAADRNRRTARFFRLVNELPAILLVGIVLLVVLKPF